MLIIDEIDYLPITKEEANMFFQLIAKRYENKPAIITTNQAFSKCGEVFGDTTITSVIIDRTFVIPKYNNISILKLNT